MKSLAITLVLAVLLCWVIDAHFRVRFWRAECARWEGIAARHRMEADEQHIMAAHWHSQLVEQSNMCFSTLRASRLWKNYQGLAQASK